MDDEDLREYDKDHNPPPGKPNSSRKAASAKGLIEKWRASNKDKKLHLFPKLHDRLSKFSPETGTPIKPVIVRDGFAEAVQAPTGKVEFDQEDIVCFSARWAWCGTTATWRRIVPADMATKHVGYPKPEFNQQRRDLLHGYLLEIHGDEAVLMWRLIESEGPAQGTGRAGVPGVARRCGRRKSLEVRRIVPTTMPLLTPPPSAESCACACVCPGQPDDAGVGQQLLQDDRRADAAHHQEQQCRRAEPRHARVPRQALRGGG